MAIYECQYNRSCSLCSRTVELPFIVAKSVKRDIGNMRKIDEFGGSDKKDQTELLVCRYDRISLPNRVELLLNLAANSNSKLNCWDVRVDTYTI